MGWMANRKWKEIKQEPGRAVQGNMLGCCLLSFHFLWAIHPILFIEFRKIVWRGGGGGTNLGKVIFTFGRQFAPNI